MFFLISPAKKLNENKLSTISDMTEPYFKKNSEILLKRLLQLAPQEIASLYKVSDKLAFLNVERYRTIDAGTAKTFPAIELFAGDVYRGINYADLSVEAKDYLNHSLGILSGLYGLLRARSEISPYRLEMGSALVVDEKNKNLYQFWTKAVTAHLNDILQQEKHHYIINLASVEYAKVLDKTELIRPMINIQFKRKDPKTGDYKIVGILAKYARGLMVKYAAQNQLSEVLELQNFNLDNYVFKQSLSSESEWVFIQNS